MKSKFDDWFVSQHGQRTGTVNWLKKDSDEHLRTVVHAGKLAEAELEHRKSWDMRLQSALYAWCARDSDCVANAQREDDLRKQVETLQAREKACESLDEAEKIALVRAMQECVEALNLPQNASLADVVKAVRVVAEKARKSELLA